MTASVAQLKKGKNFRRSWLSEAPFGCLELHEILLRLLVLLST
jgi:hypothetical protein